MSSRAQDRLSTQEVGTSLSPNGAAPNSGAPNSGVHAGRGQPAAHFPSHHIQTDPSSLTLPLPEGAVQLRTISYIVYCDIHVLIHDIHDPDQAEWDKTLAEVEPLVRSDSLKGVLVRSFGGGPTPHQRRQVIELYQGKQMPVANVSDSAVTRAITTAISWFYRGTMRSYSPVDLPKAVQYLGIPATNQPEFLTTVFALCANRGRRAM